jgi:hypothetical protein
LFVGLKPITIIVRFKLAQELEAIRIKPFEFGHALLLAAGLSLYDHITRRSQAHKGFVHFLS